MRSILIAAVVLLALPALAAARTDGANETTAAAACKAQRAAMTPAVFKQTYGTGKGRSNAFGQCVARTERLHQQAHSNAAKSCRAEQSDSSFAAAHDGKTFAQFYGTGPRGRNAFGKCVSAKAKQNVAERLEAIVNAAKACKAERSDPNFAASHGGKTFAQQYGTNANKSNAFGKCVSSKSKTS